MWAEALKPVNVPTDRIAKTLSPTDAQRSALDSLDEATQKAADFPEGELPQRRTGFSLPRTYLGDRAQTSSDAGGNQRPCNRRWRISTTC